jgi:ribose transport system ATP-binding protein
MAGVPLLEIEHLGKAFDATQAVRDFSVSVAAGEFIGLVGPNGAGKSTLIKILDGVYVQDKGTIKVHGKPVAAGRGRLPGIGVVHQDLGVVSTMTVAENLRLGLPPLTVVGPLLSTKMEREFSVGALNSVGLAPTMASRMMGSLTIGEQTLVAVARTLARGADLLVVDEATSALSSRESEWLLDHLRGLTAAGAAVIIVSHKMSEIVRSTDRCVVMVDGLVAADVPTASVDAADLGRLMAPVVHSEEASTNDSSMPRAIRDPGEPVLQLHGACTAGSGPFDVTVHAGEVVGVTGLVGSGIYELAWLAAGVVRPTRGTRTVPCGVRVALLPPNRGVEGNFAERPAVWNLTIGALSHWRRRTGLINLHREYEDACDRYRELNVLPDDPRHLQGQLSGGNQQKILIGRALLQSTDCLVLCEPTRGVDVRTRAEIYKLVKQSAADGTAVLVVSSDAEDLLALADRVGVVVEGRLDTLTPVGALDDERMAALL